MRNDRQSGWGWRNSPQGYGRLSIGLHWVMLLLIAAVFACIEIYETFPEDSPTGEALEVWHVMLGLSVFALVWLRLLVHLTGPAPYIEPPPAVWQHEVGGTAMYVLIGLHATAALFHHHIARDNTLTRMLPPRF